ncbi:MAG: hypothetical protein IIY55_02620 [Blautia sp.]|nr:hypothetical protein [Blautia sp.]
MSIIGTGNYINYKPETEMPAWVQSERYEYCDGFYEDYTGKNKGLLHRIALMILSIF